VTAEMVEYEGMTCSTCGEALYLEDEGATVCIRCLSCGPKASVLLIACGGGKRPGCGAKILFGGKSGKVPVNIKTGASHFIDCPRAQNFRRPAKQAAPSKPTPSSPQGGLF